MPSPLVYGTVGQLKAFVGALKLAGMTKLADDESKDALYSQLLLAASGEMNGVFQRIGYTLPLDFDPTSELGAQLAALLALHCFALAAWGLAAGIVGESDGLIKAKQAADDWLATLAAGTGLLLGVTRGVDSNAARLAGRVGVVLGNDDLDRLDHQLFGFQHLIGRGYY